MAATVTRVSAMCLAAVCWTAVVSCAPSDYYPVPGYEVKLQSLGQHVDLHHIPTKVIHVTKTVAIKVPVPYPVKIPHGVPYPVPVTKIVQVPQPVVHRPHEEAESEPVHYMIPAHSHYS